MKWFASVNNLNVQTVAKLRSEGMKNVQNNVKMNQMELVWMCQDSIIITETYSFEFGIPRKSHDILHEFCDFSEQNLDRRLHTLIHRERGGGGGVCTGSGPPLIDHKNIRFLSYTGLGPLKITKLPCQHLRPSSARQRNAIAGWSMIARL